MIIPLPFIVSLLFTITYATDFKQEIIYERCQADMACFIREDCLSTPAGSDPKKTLVRFEGPMSELKDNQECDAIIQIKSFSESKYLVIMQLTSANSKFATDDTIAIMQNDKRQVACKNELDAPEADSDAVPTGSELNFKYEGVNPKEFTEAKLFCSFFLNAKDANTYIADSFRTLNKPPSLVRIDKDNVHKDDIVYDSPKQKFWQEPTRTNVNCPLEDIVSGDSSDESYELIAIDLTKSSLKCEGMEMRVVLTPETGEPVESLLESSDSYICKKKNSATFVWAKQSDNNIPLYPASYAGKILIACVSKKYCKLCATPTIPEKCSNCKLPTESPGEKGCKTLKCDNSEFTFDGENSAKAQGGVLTCKKSKVDATKSGWFFQGHKDAVEEEKEKVGCDIIRVCPREQFKHKCEGKTDKDCSDFKLTEYNFTCPHGGDLRKDDEKEGGTKVTPKCDQNNGQWSEVENNDVLYCADVKESNSGAKVGTGGGGLGVGPIIGIVAAVLVIGGIACVVLFFKVIKPKLDAGKKTTKKEGTSKKEKVPLSGELPKSAKSSNSRNKTKSDPNKDSEKKESNKETPKDAPATPAAAPTPSPAVDGKTPATPADGKAPATPAAPGAPAGGPAAAPGAPPPGPPTNISELKTDPEPSANPPDATPV